MSDILEGGSMSDIARNRYGGLFVLFSAAYLLQLASPPSLATPVLKILPILTLVARAATSAPVRQRPFLALGLTSSLVGDLALALGPRDLFVGGLAAFFVAHVFYIVTFRRDGGHPTRALPLSALVVAWCIAAGLVIVPRLGPLRAPVAAYMVVIATMGVAAAFTTRAPLTLFAGAFAFIVSDSILAFDRFVAHVRYAPYLVMATYYFGQYFIVEGVIGTAPRTALQLSGRRP
jgi:uncharacterized membrane protein YhhN